MADYDRSPKTSHRSYKPSRDRTAEWLGRLPSKHAASFANPEMPPSDTESAIYSSDSDGESSRSVPPRFVLRFPDGREERVSDSYYTNPNASSRDVRSRSTSGPVNYGPPPSHHHHSRSMSMHQAGGHPRGYLFRPHSSNANVRHQEDIRILPPQRSVTPGYINPRPVQGHHSRTSSVVAPSPRRAYTHDSPGVSHRGQSDEWVTRHGPPEAIKFSQSHPPSRYDMPTRDYSASGYRSRASSKVSRQAVIGSPSSQMSELTKENTIANSHSRTLSWGIIEDNWTVIDEDEEWEKEQQRTARRRGRTSSQSSGSPPLTYSRSRTTSSSSRSGYYPPSSKLPGPEKFGPPPANSTGAGSTKRPFFSRLFRTGNDKNVPVIPPPPSNRLHRRHSISDSRR